MQLTKCLKTIVTMSVSTLNRAFHGLGQAKFPDGDSVLGSRHFSILPQLPPKILLNSKVVKIDIKIIKQSYRFVNLYPLHTL